MRKAIISLLILTLLSTGFATPEISIINTALSANSIHAGESGSISFTIVNTGDTKFDNVNIILTSPLNLEQTSYTFTNIKKGESRFITTTYTAPALMESGTYSILISADYKFGDESYSNQGGAIVKVLPTNYLIVSEYTSRLVIDDYTTIILNMTNHGNSDLRNVFIELVMPDGFIPETGAQFFKQRLAPSENALFQTRVFVEKGIEPDSYQFTLNKQADGYANTDILNIAVTGTPKIIYSGVNLDPDIPIIGDMQTISVRFENIGSGKAYNIVAELLLDQQVIGTTTEYLGTLDRDDLTSAIFDFITPKDNKITGKVKITYTDAEGAESFLIKDITYDLIAVSKVSTNSYLLIAGVIAVLAYLIYKKYYKKKK